MFQIFHGMVTSTTSPCYAFQLSQIFEDASLQLSSYILVHKFKTLNEQNIVALGTNEPVLNMLPQQPLEFNKEIGE